MSQTDQPTGINNFTGTYANEINQSINQLCHQMAINNISIPKFATYKNACDFIRDYEIATYNCKDEQRLALLLQAFASCDSRAWVEKDLKTMITNNKPWKEIKEAIIERHTGTSSIDKHFKKLRELTFDPEGNKRLLDFVEEIFDAYDKAHFGNKDEKSSIRYAKAALPSSVKATLSLIPGFLSADSQEEFKKIIHQYDVTRGSESPSRSTNRADIQELTNVIKSLVDSVKKDNEDTRKSFVAALKPFEERFQRYSSPQFNRPASPSYPSRGYHQRSQSPLKTQPSSGRQSSPGRSYHVENKDINMPEHNSQRLEVSEQNENQAFNSKAYYDRFGVPPRPYKKIELSIKPHGTNEKPKCIPFYISAGATTILGYEALLGINSLQEFMIQIRFDKGAPLILSNDVIIGKQCETPRDFRGSVRIDTRIEDKLFDPLLVPVLKRFKKVFSDIDRRPIMGSPMRFMTTHQRPVFAKQRHYNLDEVVQMKEHIASLLHKGIIEPTVSGYAATSRIIPKKSGAGRLVVNYIPLNAVTLRDSYVLPHISDILGVLTGMRYFSTLDCAQGFYQISVDPRDRHKTAFSTPIGNFQFVRCPFGARNSCAKFQAEMNRIFAAGLYTKCVVYVDDILVFGRTRHEHDANLTWVLEQCNTFNVKLKIDKCQLAQEQVKFLGYQLNGKHIQPLKEKVDALSCAQRPKDKTELRSLVGKLNFYSRFIPNYSKQLEPLRELFRHNKDFQWKQHHEDAFKKLITSLHSAPKQVLTPRNEKKTLELWITPDTIEVLCLDINGQLIHRTSRFLTGSEINYSITELQLLALVMAVNKFKVWLDPNALNVRVPDKHLEKILSLKHRPERIDNLLLKLPEGFDSFVFNVKEELLAPHSDKIKCHVPQEIYYIDGACKGNGKSDCIASWAVCAEFDRELEEVGLVNESPSNNTAETTAAIRACEIAKLRGQTEITVVTDSKYLHSAVTINIDKWKNNDWQDYRGKPVVNATLFKELMNVKEGLQIEWIHVKGHSDHAGNTRADNLARGALDIRESILCASPTKARVIIEDCEEIRQLKEEVQDGKSDLICEDDTLYYIDNKLEGMKRIYVPKQTRTALMNISHDNQLYGGHVGIKKTLRKLLKYWWPGIARDVERYVKSCDTCQRFKDRPGMPPGYLHNIPVSNIFQHLHVDIVGPFKATFRGNLYIVTATCALSKYAYAKPLKSITTSDVIQFLEDSIFSVHGLPDTIISDRGSQFTSQEWKRQILEWDIKHNLTTPYHPQSNGIDERFNGTLVRILKSYVADGQEDWDDKVKWALWLYNTTVHESTGFSPFQILHGFEPRSPLKSTPSEKPFNHSELSNIRQSIRNKANDINKLAQAKQKRLYDSNRSYNDLKLGDTVLLKEHSIPSYLSKKLYPKWYGPGIVVGFVEENGLIKAAKVMDCDSLTIKTISISDVKHYNTRQVNEVSHQEINTQPKKKGDAQEPLYQSTYYNVERPKLNQPVVRETDSTDTSLSSLDMPDDRNLVNSSPRRVTFNEIPHTFNYDTDDAESNPSSQPPTVDAQELSVIHEPSIEDEPTIIEDATSAEQIFHPPIPEKSPYVMDFIIDNSILDPTVKINTKDIPESDRVLRPRKPKATETISADISSSSDSTSELNEVIQEPIGYRTTDTSRNDSSYTSAKEDQTIITAKEPNSDTLIDFDTTQVEQPDLITLSEHHSESEDHDSTLVD